MTISKTTVNFANKRELDVTDNVVHDVTNNEIPAIWVWEADNVDEPLFIYLANDDGTFTWYGNVCLDAETAEELPAHIKDEKHLREVLSFLSTTV